MDILKEQEFTGERALFCSKDLKIYSSVFYDGESPLKESKNIELYECIFKWKYPLWYSENIKVTNTTLLDTARSGIWYTRNINIENSTVDAPKTFRRSSGITLKNVSMMNAQETMWNCKDISLDTVFVRGDYFAFGSTDIEADNLNISGNYAFDGGKNIVIKNSRLISKDAFWNCENVTVYNSTVIGEYLGWNSKNVTFIDCTIESNQGMCYMDNIVMKNCRLVNTDLAFEYSSADCDIDSSVISIKNPKGGKISVHSVGELIMEENRVDISKTEILFKK